MRFSSSLLILTGTLIVVVACGAAFEGGAQSTTRAVNVVITCPTDLENEQIALGVTVAPWVRGAEPGDTLRWRFVNANATGVTGILIRKKADVAWPWTSETEFPPTSTNGAVTITEATLPANASTGDYAYDIVLECNGTEVLIDPVMRIF